MLLLGLLLVAACDSTMTCAVACEKDDAAACLWLARERDDMRAAARACALDDKTCDELARHVLRGRKSARDVDEAVARIGPACDRGDLPACESIVEAALPWIGKDAAPPALTKRAGKAAERWCAAVTPRPCEGVLCDHGWDSVLSTCERAADAFALPGLAGATRARALATCKKDAGVCVDLVFASRERWGNAVSASERAAHSRELAEVVQRVLAACRTPDDRACRALELVRPGVDQPSVARAVAQKLCAVQGGAACSEQAVRDCDEGRGKLSSCVDAVLTEGGLGWSRGDGIEKKLAEACIKDDKRACFAVGVLGAGLRWGGALLEADDAFARGCKLKHAPSCRAAKSPASVGRPGPAPADVIKPTEGVAVHVRSRGDGAPLANVVLVDQWRWEGKAVEGRHVRAVIDLRDHVALGGLREGADVVVYDAREDTVERSFAVVNVAP